MICFVSAARNLEDKADAMRIEALKSSQAISERKVRMVKEKRERERLVEGNFVLFPELFDVFVNDLKRFFP